MAKSVTNQSFTLYTLRNNRWEIQGTYGSGKKNQAIQDAKALESISTVFGVKVVQEELDNNANTIEKVIFIVEKLKEIKKNKARKEEREKKEKERKEKEAEAEEKALVLEKEKQQQNTLKKSAVKTVAKKSDEYNFSQYLLRFIGIIILSIAGGLMMSGITMLWLQETSVAPHIQIYILAALFFLGFFVFIMTAMPMISASKPVKAKSIFKDTEPSLTPTKDVVNIDDANSVSYSDFRAEAAKLQKSEAKAPDTSSDEIKADVSSGEKEAVPNDNTLEDEADDLPETDKDKSFILSYLRVALKLAEIDRKQLDNYNKFAITLFMAGACDALTKARGLNTTVSTMIVTESVKYIGLNDSNAENFSDKIQKYLITDAKYMQAFNNGRGAMNAHIRNQANGFTELKNALEEWNKPNQKEETSSLVTVLFTDIAGSTALTQSQGDEGAQQIVRVHNRIVRGALDKFNGKEIKHTGDGIMASFINTTDAVSAAAEMQSQSKANNKTNPTLPLNLKVGLDTGEPIAEDNDLFGVTVQLAARLVDKAQAGQVFVSETVQAICKGKNIKFASRGLFSIKGFDEELMVYELLWNPEAQKIESAKVRGKIKKEVKSDDTNEVDSKELHPAIFRADIIDYKRLSKKSAEDSIARLNGALEYMVETIKIRKGVIIPPKSIEPNDLNEPSKLSEPDDTPNEVTAKVSESGVVLSSFPDVIEAINATVIIQNKLNALNQNISKRNQVHFRVGIIMASSSDLIEDIQEQDLEHVIKLNTLAKAGELCVSGDVAHYSKDLVDINFDEGEEEPEPLYRWRPDIFQAS